MNNTSLILLFEVSRGRNAKFLLFSGDAETASWSRVLSDPVAATLLRKVDLYKIGHHGSARATPLELVRLWQGDRDRPRVGLLSTQSGLFGNADRTGEVPSRRLLDDLSYVMTIVSSESYLPMGYVSVEAPISGRSGFSVGTP